MKAGKARPQLSKDRIPLGVILKDEEQHMAQSKPYNPTEGVHVELERQVDKS